MTAQVSNAALVGATARLTRAYGATARQQVDSLEGATAAPGREQAQRYYDDEGPRAEPGARRRRGEFQDQVISFGGVLVSLEVGSAIVQAQALNGLYPPHAAEAERQVANYEFVQAMAGPAEPIIVPRPL
jgi:hypothetical protein